MDATFTDAAIRDALAGLAALGLQTAMPGPKEPPAPGLFGSLDMLRTLLWVAVACGAATLAWFLKDILPRGVARRARWTEGDAAAPGVAAADAAARDDADALAEQGRFVEAMHVLLLQGLADMRARLDQGFADSLTSREILRRAPVPPPARAALRDMIDAVERTYFGGHPGSQTDYSLCRGRFTALVEALGAPQMKAPQAAAQAPS